ncbi:MAG: hypothetical protein PCFJNLEI_00860 [Verrucomicrobiae bacterium]|nr:hypothetical protein [Verrucomicrobiae bacterium]
MWNKIKFYLVSLLLIGLAGAALYYKYFPQQAVVTRPVDVPALVLQIQQLSELVTVKYSVQKMIGLEEQKIPFGTERVLLTVQAKVYGSVDLKTVTVNAGPAGLEIQLPPARIFDVAIDDRATRVWDHSLSRWAVWVSPNPDLEQSARRAALVDVELTAKQMGIISNAQVNAETSIREFLRLAGHSNVTFRTVQ